MSRRDDDLRDELRSHLEMATADRLARGEDPASAAAGARRELGNPGQIDEATRDVWGRRWLERLVQDVRYALRTFRRNPGFAAVAVLSLALGIGANTALFEVVEAVRLKALPVAAPSQLVEVHITDMDRVRGARWTWHAAVTNPVWEAMRARQMPFATLFAWGADTFSLSAGGEARYAAGLWVSGGFFRTLGLRPAAGRLLDPGDDRPGCPARVVLSHGFWERAYGGNPQIVGQTLSIGAHPAEIVGVAPPGFHGMEVGRSFDLALPICADAVFSDDGRGRLALGTEWWLSVFGRLNPGWTVPRARAYLASASPELFRETLPPEYPAASVDDYRRLTLTADPGGSGLSQLRESYASPLWLLLGLAGLVLVIACANLANLLLARATARQREFAVRLGLGASRWRVVRQLVTEGLVLSAIGGLGALLLATTLGRTLVAFLDPGGADVQLTLGLDPAVVAFAVAVAVLTSLLFSLAPAVKTTRVGAGAMARANVRGGTAGREAVGLRRALVIAQVALSVLLVFGSILFTRSLRALASVDPGFDARRVVVAGVNFRRVEMAPEGRTVFRRALVDRVRHLPGVQSAAATQIVPVSGMSRTNAVWPADRSNPQIHARWNTVGAGYFATLGIPFVAGRDFDDRDGPSSTPAVIVSETLARALAADGQVIGARLIREPVPGTPETKTFEIVGVVQDSTYADLREPRQPLVYVPDSQSPPQGYLRVVVRSSLPASAISAAITSALANLDPRIGVTYSVLAETIDQTLVRERLLAALSIGFGGLAALLTIVGLYGLVAYTVTQRTNEIGVRMALGATSADIARLMVNETGVLMAIGLAAGIALALAAAPAAASLLFGVAPTDPATLALSIAALALIAVAATAIPARRATRIAPVVALRAE